ncbi:hypothetical protein F4776DRAFT_676649 [Hypoxylon sp. NC0597]|nr:hypothetical protein F4776DRAFT_676649 [Hypoxylon sp. NC0597]
MDRQVKNRRFHKKSRRGCLECKRRHIKCDERRPTCDNCDVAARSCCYAGQIVSPEARSRTAWSPNDLDLAMEDWLMVTQPMEFLVQAYMALALSTPYLMNQLLALSAQHLSIICQDQIDTLKKSVVAKFPFSSLVRVQALAQTLSANRDDFAKYIDGVVDCKKLQRAVQIIGESSWAILRESPLSEWIASIEEFEKLHDVIFPGGLHDLHAMLLLSETDEESIEACAGTVQASGFLHRRLDALNTTYVRLLGDRRPEALVVLAHWAVYLHRCRGFWAFRDTGDRYLIRAICGELRDRWKEWLSVPLQAISDT